MHYRTTKLHRFTGGLALGLGTGTIGLAFVAFQNPTIPLDFAGATALIGIFTMAIGRVCMTDRSGEETNDAEMNMADNAEAPAAT